MKTLSLVLTLLICAGAQAADLEQLRAEYEASAQQVATLYRNLQIDQVKFAVNSVMTEKVKEVITEKSGRSKSESQRAGLSLLFISAKGSMSNASSSSEDVTKLIVQNAVTTAGFNLRERTDYDDLHAKLLSWVEAHEAEIILFKETGVETIAAAFNYVQAGGKLPEQSIVAVVQMLSQVHFIGQYSVTRCVKTKYANREKLSDSSDNMSVSAHIFGIFKGHYNEESSTHDYWRQLAHTETECSSSTNQIKVTPEDTVYFVNYSMLDQKLQSWVKALDQAYLAQDSSVYYPTFGLPNYNN